MNRIKINLPDNFRFKTEITIRITDINYGGHLGNDKVLSLMQEARVRFLKELGYTEMNIEGFGIIMTDAAVEYKSESFYGDIVVIEVQADDFNKYGFDMFYKLSNKDSGKEIARGKTGLMIFDYKKRKITSVPEKFIHNIKPLLKNE